jgi:hypothetical protein
MRCNLGGPRGDLALIRHRLISLSAVAINAFHLWTTTDFDGAHVITSDALSLHPSGLRKIFDSIAKPSSTTYVHKPLASGRDCIDILLNNIRNTTDPTSLAFEVIAATWYHNLLLRGRYANNSSGVDNGIFAANGVQLQHSST